MRAGRPRSQAMPSQWFGRGCLAGGFSESRRAPFGKLPFARKPGPRPPRLGRSIEKDYKLNIDAQDAQDNQDGRLLQETLTRAMIACGFEDVREHKPAVSGKNPVHPVHPCESKIYPCLTMNRFPATRRRHLFQASGAPALPCGSSEGETGLFQTSGAPALPGRSSEGETGLFQTSRPPALPCGSFEGETGFVSGKWGPCPAGQIIRG